MFVANCFVFTFNFETICEILIKNNKKIVKKYKTVSLK